MKIIGNFDADWELRRIHVNPTNKCKLDGMAKPLTFIELIEALFTQRRHGKVLDDLMCSHCESISE